MAPKGKGKNKKTAKKKVSKEVKFDVEIEKKDVEE